MIENQAVTQATNPDPIQEQLVAVRRLQILDAATVVFAARGFHKSSIRQIASEAGVADGTIYIYFKNKTDLLMGLLNRLNESEQRPASFVAIAHGDLRTHFVAYIRHRLTFIEAHLQTFRAILPEILADSELRTLYRQQIIEPTFVLAEAFAEVWVNEEKLRPIAPTFLLRMLASTVIGLLVLRLLDDRAIADEWQQLPEMLSDLCVRRSGETTMTTYPLGAHTPTAKPKPIDITTLRMEA